MIVQVLNTINVIHQIKNVAEEKLLVYDKINNWQYKKVYTGEREALANEGFYHRYLLNYGQVHSLSSGHT